MRNWSRYLLSSAIILSGIFVAQLILGLPSFQKKTSGYGPQVSKIQESSINGLTLKEGSLEFDLKQTNENWILEGRKADTTKIDEIFSLILEKSGPYDLASDNPSHFSDFGIASESATLVTLKSNDEPKLSVLLGKISYPGQFISVKDAQSVYLARTSLDFLEPLNKAEFWDKSLVTTKTSEIKKIRIAGKEDFILVKENDKWTFEENKKEAKDSKITEFLSRLELLRADSFLENRKDQSKYPEKVGEITLESDGRSENLTFYGKGSQTLVERKSDGELLIFSSDTLKDLLPSRSSLLP